MALQRSQSNKAAFFLSLSSVVVVAIVVKLIKTKLEKEKYFFKIKKNKIINTKNSKSSTIYRPQEKERRRKELNQNRKFQLRLYKRLTIEDLSCIISSIDLLADFMQTSEINKTHY